jgi:hypothetical protein
MGQGTGEERAQPVTAEQLRDEIEDARRDLGDTAAALAAKTDVKTRATEKADELKQRARANPVPLAAGAGVFLLVVVLTRRRGRR